MTLSPAGGHQAVFGWAVRIEDCHCASSLAHRAKNAVSHTPVRHSDCASHTVSITCGARRKKISYIQHSKLTDKIPRYRGPDSSVAFSHGKSARIPWSALSVSAPARTRSPTNCANPAPITVSAQSGVNVFVLLLLCRTAISLL